MSTVEEKAPRNQMIYLYHIHRSYSKVSAWSGDPITRERTGTHTCRPNYDLTHRQRYEIIARWLNERGCAAPPYFQPGFWPNKV